jgi:hypothetical protein
MSHDAIRKCPECQGEMASIVLMDKVVAHPAYAGVRELEYREPDDRRGFWSGKYATAGRVQAFMCGACGRIVLYGSVQSP